ncbi:SnoaL-like domain protein [Crateriforma conspicua]|uniref:SnoaL-like domain protein n=2 Tax=Crateriforma conspicua TaxID=2527996 RepID=A0A5C6FLL3_9PLAN|nr:SnoaL-like domain protein [Crateriforma conspicua]
MNEAEVKATVDRFIDAWNAKDLASFAECFVEDGDFVNVVAQKAEGSDAIAKMHKHAFETVQSKSTLSLERLDIRELSDRLAGVDFWWKVVGSVSPEGEPMPERTGLIYFVIDSDEGKIVSGRNADYSEKRY